MTDNDVVLISTPPNERTPVNPTEPIPVIAPRSDTGIFDELVRKLGHNPLDHADSGWDEYNLASQYLTETLEHLKDLSHTA